MSKIYCLKIISVLNFYQLFFDKNLKQRLFLNNKFLTLLVFLKKFFFSKRILFSILKKLKLYTNISNINLNFVYSAQLNTIFNNSKLSNTIILQKNFKKILTYKAKRRLVNKLYTLSDFLKLPFVTYFSYITKIHAPLQLLRLTMKNLNKRFIYFLKYNKFSVELRFIYSILSSGLNPIKMANFYYNSYFYKLKAISRKKNKLLIPVYTQFNILKIKNLILGEARIEEILIKINKNLKLTSKFIEKKKKVKVNLKTLNILQNNKMDLLIEKINKNFVNKLFILVQSSLFLSQYKKNRKFNFSIYNESPLNYNKNLFNFSKLNKFLV